MSTRYCERLRNLRKELKLSQEYVAKQLGVSRTAITQIEAGSRKVSASELEVFANMYGVSMDVIMNGEKNNNVRAIARAFNELDERDQEEVMNLIQFKKRLKKELIVNAQ